jgi:hypothetical protein
VCHVPSTTTSNRAAPGWWPWGLGLLVALGVIGPGLALGPMLSFDLQVTPTIEVPPGTFGLGPGLSQRVPLFALLGVGSALVGGPAVAVAFLAACLAVGFAGLVRLVRIVAPGGAAPAGAASAWPVAVWPVAIAAGLWWAAGPFALTRLGAGHLNLVWMVAVLPWALPRLCRPCDHPPSTFLAALLLAVGGPGAGTVALVVSAVALVLERREEGWVRGAVASVAPHLVWVGPTAVLLWAGAGVSGAGEFATDPAGAAGWPAVLAGSGFWRSDLQVGAAGVPGAVAGLVLGSLAIVGARSVLVDAARPRWQRTATVVAGVGLALALASAVPGVRELYRWASELPVGAPLRESQRFLALWLVWAAPLAALGALVAARWRPGSAARWLPTGALAASVLVVSVPGWWGVEGRLAPVEIPASWDVARERIEAAPGPVMALPWSQHPRLSFADGRQAFNPVPAVLGGDVISSYDPLFDRRRPSQEQVDGRATEVDRLVREVRSGAQVGDELAALGIRWVILVHEDAWESYRILDADPRLAVRLREPDLDLYEVIGWRGPAVAPDGTSWPVDRPVPPIVRTDAPAGSVLQIAGAPGWVQGWGDPLPVTADGRLEVTSTGGPIWFWPAFALLATYVVVLVVAGACLRSRSRRYGRILALRPARG